MISVLLALFALHGAVISVDTAAMRQPTLAVMTLQGRSIQPDEAEVLGEAITSQLKSLGKYRVIERSQIEKILAEQGFQNSGACDKSECAVEVGRIAGIDQMVVGSVGKLGNTWSMVIRMVSVQTGEILASAQDAREGQVDVLLRESVPVLVSQLLGLGAKVVPTSAPPAPVVDRAHARQLQSELSQLVDNREYLAKKGLLRAQNLSDSIEPYVRQALYQQRSVSGWWALANYPIVPIGSMIQGDWAGVGFSAIGYLCAIVIASQGSNSSLGSGLAIG